MPQSRAEVGTDKPARYAKQLASHLGRKCEVAEETTGTRVTLPADRGSGSCLLSSGSGVLVLEAEAENVEVLQTVNDVVGGHLERFGERDGLAVSWQNAG